MKPSAPSAALRFLCQLIWLEACSSMLALGCVTDGSQYTSTQGARSAATEADAGAAQVANAPPPPDASAPDMDTDVGDAASIAVCSDDAMPGLRIEVMPQADWRCRQLVVKAFEGDHEEMLHAENPADPCTFVGARERPGTYAITITGYGRTQKLQGLRVLQGVCHVEPALRVAHFTQACAAGAERGDCTDCESDADAGDSAACVEMFCLDRDQTYAYDQRHQVGEVVDLCGGRTCECLTDGTMGNCQRTPL